MKIRVFDKLFGGPLHGRRVALDASSSVQNFASLTSGATMGCHFGDYATIPPKTMSFVDQLYTRRRGVFGDTEVIFFTYYKHDDKRAWEMLVNYALRGSRWV